MLLFLWPYCPEITASSCREGTSTISPGKWCLFPFSGTSVEITCSTPDPEFILKTSLVTSFNANISVYGIDWVPLGKLKLVRSVWVSHCWCVQPLQGNGVQCCSCNSHEVQNLHQYAALWLLCWPAHIFLSLISLCCGILDFLLVIIGVSGCSHHHSLHDLHHMLCSCPGNANNPRHTPLSCISLYRTTRFSL